MIGALFTNYLWLKMDQYPVEGHELMGLTPIAQIYRGLMDKQYPYSQLYDKILNSSGIFFGYPPLSFLVVLLFYLIFGPQGQMVVMVNSIYIVLAIVCVYLIGKHIFNKPTGLLAAFILSSFPGFIGFSRQYWIEFGLIGYVCLDLYLLLKTNFFENRKYSILLGIALALSFLHKYEFILFIIGPLLLLIYKSGVLKDISRLKWSNKLTNFILTLVLALGITSFLWVRYSKDILGRMFSVTFHNENAASQMIFPAFYLYSIAGLIGLIFLTLFFLSIIFLIIRAILKEDKRFHIAYLILGVIVSYTIFTLFLTKNTSHILAVLPFIAILISAALYFIKNRVVTIILTGVIFIYCLNLHLHYFYSPYPIEIINTLNRSTLTAQSHCEDYGICSFWPPRKERLEYAIKEISEYIKANSRREKNTNALVVFERRNFNNCIFKYYSLIGDYKIEFFYCCNPVSDISQPDFIIIEALEGESIAEILSREYDPVHDKERGNFKKIFKNGIGDFELIKIFKIPNGDKTALIYKRKKNF